MILGISWGRDSIKLELGDGRSERWMASADASSMRKMTTRSRTLVVNDCSARRVFPAGITPPLAAIGSISAPAHEEGDDDAVDKYEDEDPASHLEGTTLWSSKAKGGEVKLARSVSLRQERLAGLVKTPIRLSRGDQLICKVS